MATIKDNSGLDFMPGIEIGIYEKYTRGLKLRKFRYVNCCIFSI